MKPGGRGGPGRSQRAAGAGPGSGKGTDAGVNTRPSPFRQSRRRQVFLQRRFAVLSLSRPAPPRHRPPASPLQPRGQRRRPAVPSLPRASPALFFRVLGLGLHFPLRCLSFFICLFVCFLLCFFFYFLFFNSSSSPACGEWGGPSAALPRPGQSGPCGVGGIAVWALKAEPFVRRSPAGTPHRQPAGPACGAAVRRRPEEPWTTLRRRLRIQLPPSAGISSSLPCTQINVWQPGLPRSPFCWVWGGCFLL